MGQRFGRIAERWGRGLGGLLRNGAQAWGRGLGGLLRDGVEAWGDC